MKNIKILSLLVCLVAVLVGCSKEDEHVSSPIDRTVLVYIAGDNTLASFVEDDLSEMIEGMNEVDDSRNNLLIYIDYGSAPQLIRLEKDKKNNVVQKVVVTYDRNRNSVSIANMQEVMNTAFSKYPASSYGLVLWSHGDGWIPSSVQTRWWGQDGWNNYMDITDLHEVLRSAPHFDFILFDACFMQSVEVAYELRDYANYIISSPTEIPAPGAPYHKVVPALFGKGAYEKNIAKSYFDFYADKDLYTGDLPSRWKRGDPWTAGVSVSVVNTAALEQLAYKTKEILPQYIIDGQTINVSDIMCYDRRYSGTRKKYKYYYDFDGFMQSLNCPEYEAWRAIYDEVVMFWGTTDKNYSSSAGSFSMTGSAGLSIYIPREVLGSEESDIPDYYHQSVQWYSAAGWNETGW